MRPSGTRRPGFGVRDALMPFTAPALVAKAAIERLAAPPAGPAASAVSMSTAPATPTMVRALRTDDLLNGLERVGLLKYRLRRSTAPGARISAHFRHKGVTKARGYHELVTELTPEERARLAELAYYEPPEPVRHEPRFPFLRKLFAPFLALGALLLKFGGVLLKGKFLLSMFVSAALYVWWEAGGLASA